MLDEINSEFETALHSFRFVRLLNFASNKHESISDDFVQIYHSFHSIVTCNRADTHDRCALLVSLLCGFGMDAYVAYGTVCISRFSRGDKTSCICLLLDI